MTSFLGCLQWTISLNARRLTVCIGEFLSLEVENKDIFESFFSYYFTISRSSTLSKLTIDQDPKQSNNLNKST